MIIKPKTLPKSFYLFGTKFLSWFLKKRFNKLNIQDIPIQSDCSYLLMCNHLGFWDGIWALYLTYKAVHKKQNLSGFNIMILKKQLQKNLWLRYLGCFSIAPNSKTSLESLAYAAEILNKPGNILIMFPQGNLDSQYVRHIVVKDGIDKILSQVEGKCQLIWSSNLVEYFESLKPSVYFKMLDCGTNADFNFEELKSKINAHHQQAIQKQFRFTIEP